MFECAKLFNWCSWVIIIPTDSNNNLACPHPWANESVYMQHAWVFHEFHSYLNTGKFCCRWFVCVRQYKITILEHTQAINEIKRKRKKRNVTHIHYQNHFHLLHINACSFIFFAMLRSFYRYSYLAIAFDSSCVNMCVCVCVSLGRERASEVTHTHTQTTLFTGGIVQNIYNTKWRYNGREWKRSKFRSIF